MTNVKTVQVHFTGLRVYKNELLKHIGIFFLYYYC